MLKNTTFQLDATDIVLAATDGSFSIRVPAIAGDLAELVIIDTAANSAAPTLITVPSPEPTSAA